MRSARIRVDIHLRPYETSPCPAMQHISVTHLRQPHSTPGFAKLSPRWGGAGFYFGFTPYLLSVSACFCKCISLFKALFTTQHWLRPVVYPATRHSKFYASHRSLRHACGFTSTWGPGPISAVSVKFRQAVECWDTRSVQALRTNHDGQDPLLGHHKDEVQEAALR